MLAGGVIIEDDVDHLAGRPAARVRSIRRRIDEDLTRSQLSGRGKVPLDQAIVAVRGEIGDPTTAEHVVAEAIEHFGRMTGSSTMPAFHRQTVRGLRGRGLQCQDCDEPPFFHIMRHFGRRDAEAGSGYIVSITTSSAD
jgi:hypothetical protein